MKFLPLNVDYSSPSPDPLCSSMSAQAGVKVGYPLKSGYFLLLPCLIVKTVADGHRHVAYHNKH